MPTIVQTPAKELFIKMVVSAWDTYNARLDKLINTLPDEKIATDTAPGRNSGTYLFGHLVAISDAMLPLMGFEERMYPQLESVFVTNPDKSGLEMPPLGDLKKFSKEVNDRLNYHIGRMQPDEWFTKHNAVSEEDFSKEPHRNKLNILINRTNHLSYHLGQLIYLK